MKLMAGSRYHQYKYTLTPSMESRLMTNQDRQEARALLPIIGGTFTQGGLLDLR